MKKVIVLLVMLVGMISANGQGCLPEGITFTTQEQIDNFQTNYPGCTEIEGDVFIGYYQIVTDITNLQGLEVITSVGGNLIMMNNDNLNDLSGLKNLTILDGGLKVFACVALNSLDGLDSLSSVGGYFWIEDNDALTQLAEFENLTSFGGGLKIVDNDALNGLAGLDCLTFISGTINITGNDALIDIKELSNIQADSIVSLEILYNNSLSMCSINSICDFLAGLQGSSYIGYNAPGCNTFNEIIDACPSGIMETIKPINLIIFPNPGEDFITVSLPEMDNALLEFFNTSGEKVMEFWLLTTETQINISALPQGIYFVRLQNEKMVEVGKMVKE